MRTDNLTCGVHRVRIADRLGLVEFNLSVVRFGGIIGVAGFKDGEKAPRKGKHLMLSTSVRQWVESMEQIPI